MMFFSSGIENNTKLFANRLKIVNIENDALESCFCFDYFQTHKLESSYCLHAIYAEDRGMV